MFESNSTLHRIRIQRIVALTYDWEWHRLYLFVCLLRNTAYLDGNNVRRGGARLLVSGRTELKGGRGGGHGGVVGLRGHQRKVAGRGRYGGVHLRGHGRQRAGLVRLRGQGRKGPRGHGGEGRLGLPGEGGVRLGEGRREGLRLRGEGRLRREGLGQRWQLGLHLGRHLGLSLGRLGCGRLRGVHSRLGRVVGHGSGLALKRD